MQEEDLAAEEENVADEKEIIESGESDSADVKKPVVKSSTDPTQIYLSEIGFSPLLTPEEEVYYGRLVQKGDPESPCQND